MYAFPVCAMFVTDKICIQNFGTIMYSLFIKYDQNRPNDNDFRADILYLTMEYIGYRSLAILTLINLVMPHVPWEPFTFSVYKRNWQLIE